jgi:predicted transcriptional regulator
MEVNMKIEEGQSYDQDDFYPEDITRLGNSGDQHELACWFQEKFQIHVDNPNYLINYLREFGAWSLDELEDYEENITRLVWLIGCDIHENGYFVYSH